MKARWLGSALAIMAMGSISAQAHAAAPCWSPKSFQAAQVRELHIMLMTVSLRCRVLNSDIAASYERFLRHQAKAIADTDEQLRAHYEVDRAPTGKADFARFHTSIANHYGVGITDGPRCAMFNLVTSELANPKSTHSNFAKMADDMIAVPRIEGQRCS